MSGRLSTKTIERKDGWTPELDQMLLDTVTEGLCEGLTQVACFAKASQKIGKSKSACAFRFNTTIRKQAYEAIEKAKNIGKTKKGSILASKDVDEDVQVHFDAETTRKTNASEVVHALQELSEDTTGGFVLNAQLQSAEQPSLDTVIHMLQMIQQHNGLVEENTMRRKVSEIEQVVAEALDQVEQLKIRLQNVLEDIKTVEV